MTRKVLFLVFAAVLALAAIACGGGSNNGSTTPTQTGGSSQSPGGSGTDSDYYTAVASIFNAGQTGSDDATNKLNSDLSSSETLDQNRAAINTFLDSMVNVFSTAITDMSALNPPDDAKDAHQKFLSDIDAAKTKSSDLEGQLGGVSTTADFNAIIDAFNTQVDSLVNDANTACTALQTLDNQHGANVDLGCGQ